MAIQTRRGDFVDFVPENLLEGELATVLDRRYVYVGMPDGHAVQLGTMERINEVLAEAEEYATASSENAESASKSADEASAHEATASEHANLSKSYAVGGTGTRTGEDTDNAKYYYEYLKECDFDNLSQKVNTNQQTSNDNWQGKGVNLIKFPYFSKNGRVNRGITYNINADGAIIANGQGTEANLDSFFECANIDNNYLMLPAGTYRLSNRDDDTDTTHWVVAYKDATTELARSNRNNGIFTLTETTKVYVLTRIYRTSVVSNLVFKPMLVEVAEDGSYPTEYQRNAMGNVELTDQLTDLSKMVNNANALLEGV